MGKVRRIFDIAKELNISHIEIIDFLKTLNSEKYTIMSSISNEIHAKILDQFYQDVSAVDRLRKEKARLNVHHPNQDIDKPEKIEEAVKEEPSPNVDKKQNKPKEEENKIKTQIKQEPVINIRKVIIDEKPKSKIVDKKTGTSKVNIKTENKINIKKPERKLKKIDISSIADRINTTKKKQDTGSVKTSVSQLTKKSSKKKKSKKEEEIIIDEEGVKKVINIVEFSTVDEFARSMDIPVQDVIMQCMTLGLMVTINQRLDMETMIMVADEFEIEIHEEKIQDSSLEIEIADVDDNNHENAISRPPIVTVMGHVDHGKTSVLDYIRNENVVAGESGGITQHVGAYEVMLSSGKKITFLDTPGHEAFTAMRARGAQITDLVVIVVAADETKIMPQTIEAFDHAQAANVPIIVAINKIDRPSADVNLIKQKLSEKNILVEDWGGSLQSAEISATVGTGMDDLLEKISLEAELLDLKARQDIPARGTIVEARLDKGLGAIATVLIKKGTLKVGDIFICGSQSSKVRALLNERNVRIQEALPSDPVQILGFSDVPNSGEEFIVMKDDREAKNIAQKRAQLKREAEQRRFRKITLDQIGKEISLGKVKELNIIIKGDVDGSIEALSDSLMSLSTTEVSVKIVHRSTGNINDNDVTLAAASQAVIIAFNVKATPEAKLKARELEVDLRNYSIIYEAIEEVKLALEGLLEPEKVEEVTGIAHVLQQFKVPKLGIIAGSSIKSGKVVRNSMLRVKRDDELLHEGVLTSLKRFKDDVNEVKEGFECGIGVKGFTDFNEGDVIEVYEIKEIKRTLG
ncbi:translation initiation factor IF-2 [bacterium]|nr:MAG: translation initiation factor IF-2 [bacterium]|tara:strand:- start:3330 stop:5744 length:2415 start_codon:yes stop_codon:yes gene_type:complete